MGTPVPSFLMGILDIDVMSLVLPNFTEKFALIAGSSKQGKALLASVGWNWVTAMYLERKIIIFIFLFSKLQTKLFSSIS